MTVDPKIVELGKLIPFTIDGAPYETAEASQRAEALLRLAGRDPAVFYLGQIEGKDRPHTKRYRDDELVEIHKDARFVSIRQSAPVA